MNKTKRKRLFRKLNDQVEALEDNIPKHFLLLGESLSHIFNQNLYEVSYEYQNTYIRKELSFGRTTANRLRNIYEYFGSMEENLVERVLLEMLGWKKAKKLVKHIGKFEDALETKLIEVSDVLIFARSVSSSELEKYLEEKTNEEIWAELLRSGKDELFSFDQPQEVYLEQIFREIKTFGSAGFVVDPPILKGLLRGFDKNEDEFIEEEDKIMDILITLKEIRRRLDKIEKLIYKTKKVDSMDFGYDSKEEYDPKLVPVEKFLRSSLERELDSDTPVSELVSNLKVGITGIANFLDLEISTIQNWADKGYIEIIHGKAEEIEEERWCTLKYFRKAQLLKQNLKKGLNLAKANENSQKIIFEEIKYNLKLPYYQLSDAVPKDSPVDRLLKAKRKDE